jgi:hypothetical protein
MGVASNATGALSGKARRLDGSGVIRLHWGKVRAIADATFVSPGAYMRERAVSPADEVGYNQPLAKDPPK